MYTYNVMKGVLEPAYMLGMPLCYSSKVMIAAGIGLLVGIMSGVTVLVTLLGIALGLYFYFKNKAKKYGENEAEIVCFNRRQRKIWFDDSLVFERITSTQR